MKNLSSINTLTFYDCTINEFDAPKLNSITVDEDLFSSKNITFIVGKKNF